MLPHSAALSSLGFVPSEAPVAAVDVLWPRRCPHTSFLRVRRTSWVTSLGFSGRHTTKLDTVISVTGYAMKRHFDVPIAELGDAIIVLCGTSLVGDENLGDFTVACRLVPFSRGERWRLSLLGQLVGVDAVQTPRPGPNVKLCSISDPTGILVFSVTNQIDRIV